MKKFLFIAASAALVLTACAKIENHHKITQETPVSFGVYVPNAATKAVSATDFGGMTTNILGNYEKKGFGVFAYYTDNSDFNASESKPNFMYNQQVNGDGTGYAPSTWTYSPVKYWPNEHGSNAASAGVDKLTFFAYAPWVDALDKAAGTVKDGTGSAAATEGIIAMTGNDTAGYPTLTFKVPAKGSEQIDLLWAVAPASPNNDNAQGDPANGVVAGFPWMDLTKQQCDGKIHFLFKHALAKLDFKVQAIVDDPSSAANAIAAGSKVFVRKVEVFGNFAKTNTLNLRNTTAGVPNWGTATESASITGDPAFIFNDGKANADDKTADGDESADIAAAFVDGAGVTNSAAKLLADEHEFLIIPTNLTDGGTPGGGIKVRVTYDVETADDNLAGTLTDGTTHGSKVKNVITTATPVYLNIEGGKVYTITLKLGLTSVKMEAEVDNWTSPDVTADVNLPQNVA